MFLKSVFLTKALCTFFKHGHAASVTWERAALHKESLKVIPEDDDDDDDDDEEEDEEAERHGGILAFQIFSGRECGCPGTPGYSGIRVAQVSSVSRIPGPCLVIILIQGPHQVGAKFLSFGEFS